MIKIICIGKIKEEYLKKPDEQDITITTLKVCDKTEDGLKQFTDSSTGGGSTGGGGTTSNSGKDEILCAKEEELPTGYGSSETLKNPSTPESYVTR